MTMKSLFLSRVSGIMPAKAGSVWMRVMEVEKGIIIRELAFCLSEGFDNRVVGPEYSPWQRARVVGSGGDIKMR